LRIAVAGSHSTGKSTLIAAFLAKRPSYLYEPEAFEFLADEVELTESEGPTPEGLELLLEHSVAAVGRYRHGDSVVFERSPMDYLAYAAASRRSWPSGSIEGFLSKHITLVQAALSDLDLVVFLPVVSNGIQLREGENRGFRRRVDASLRSALVDDEYDVLGGSGSPRVVELPGNPLRQLSRLLELETGT